MACPYIQLLPAAAACERDGPCLHPLSLGFPGRAAAGDEAGPRDRRPLGAVLAASVVSAAGGALTALAVPWLVLQTTGSAGRAGIVAACAIGPVVVSALAGGLLVDRGGSRRVSAAADLLSGAAVAAIPLLALAACCTSG